MCGCVGSVIWMRLWIYFPFCTVCSSCRVNGSPSFVHNSFSLLPLFLEIKFICVPHPPARPLSLSTQNVYECLCCWAQKKTFNDSKTEEIIWAFVSFYSVVVFSRSFSPFPIRILYNQLPKLNQQCIVLVFFYRIIGDDRGRERRPELTFCIVKSST